MISIRRMSLGSGYRYLMESVAVGDGAGRPGQTLVDYYAQSGTPPGRFLGAGLAGLDDGKGVPVGSVVSEEQLFLLLGMCADPVTGKPLGRAPNHAVQSLARRITERIAAIPASVKDTERATLISQIEAEEHARTGQLRPPVAGFDLTFSPSKSVSTAWALADAGTKAVIYECHLRAIEVVLAYAEQEVFNSRSGTNGVVEEDVAGVVAAAFTHWDSRSGDPQLHDHVVVLNRAQSISDGKWRTLDSRGLYKAVVMLSEMHQGVLTDLLTEKLGWGWDGRTRQHSDALAWEVTGVPEALMAEFSQRTAAIDACKQVLVAEFVASRGRQPTATEVIALRHRATLETRPEKIHRSLAEMSAQWRERAVPYVGAEPESWVASLADRNDLPLLRSADLRDEILADVARVAVERVGGRRAVFSRFNVAAEVHRQLHGVRFASPQERNTTAERSTDMALAGSLLIDLPVLHHTPARFLRPDGTSGFRAKGHEAYTTAAILEAEARLLDASPLLDGPRVAPDVVAAVLERPVAGRTSLSVEQAVAVEQVATSARVADLLIGPAGTGKSMTMAWLRAVWETEHGPGSVIGLAPSAAAAEVLAEELGIETENTAKWLYEHRRQPDRQAQVDRLKAQLPPRSLSPSDRPAVQERVDALESECRFWQLSAGQLVILDEASLAGTFALDELVSAATDAGAKILLVGDPAQLSAVEAGGMFATLVADRDGHVPELTDVRRFRAEWEKKASVALRAGDPAVLGVYQAHGRILGGERDDLLDALYQAWRDDTDDGLSSLMIAPDLNTVSELNSRARADLVATGQVSAGGVEVAGGVTAGVGDIIVTRQNDRTLRAGKRWVRNGDRWQVTHLGSDGSVTVKPVNGRAELVLPADYVAQHVKLGYAATAYRAQGRTLDSTHAFVKPTMTREVLYVSATRGRLANYLYVDTRYDPDPHTGHDQAIPPQNAREVLAGILANRSDDVSAHDAIRRTHEHAESIATLAPEYQTIAGAAQDQHWQELLARSGLTPTQVDAVRSSPAYDRLVSVLREAEARCLDVDRTFPALVRGRKIVNAEDAAAVLCHRVQRWLDGHQQPVPEVDNLVAGVIPAAGEMADTDMVRGLTERAEAIELRAGTLAEQASAKLLPWIGHLGQPPSDPWARRQWLRCASTVAAYRDRWEITNDPRPLGTAEVGSTVQQNQRRHARAALNRAVAISRDGRFNGAAPLGLAAPVPQVERPEGIGL